jgi:hypothetical protein
LVGVVWAIDCGGGFFHHFLLGGQWSRPGFDTEQRGRQVHHSRGPDHLGPGCSSPKPCSHRDFAQHCTPKQTLSFLLENPMLAKRMMWIAWPAFLVAGLLEILVFGLVDPQDLHWFGQPLALSRQGVYTMSFFIFWALAMVSSGLTTLLSMSPVEVNR